MKIESYTLYQAGKNIGRVAVRAQAVNAAKNLAAKNNKVVHVVADLDNGKNRIVEFYPDGTTKKLWI